MKRPEQEIQKAIAKYLLNLEAVTNKKFTFFHVPNGQNVGQRMGGILKAMGLRPGVPDLVIFFNSVISPPLFVELKAKGNGLQKTQKAYIKILEDLNYDVVVLTASCPRDGVDQIDLIMQERLR